MSYEIGIRDIKPEYTHTLAKQAGREVDDGRELHLSKVTVTVALHYRDRGDRISKYYDAVFKADHEKELVELKTIGDAHNDRKNFGAENLAVAAGYAERAVISFLSDVGLNYYVRGLEAHVGAVNTDEVSVHTELNTDGERTHSTE